MLLLDEPLSALDALTRANLQDEIIDIWGKEKKTVVLITNDVDEGIIMADRIIPLNPRPGASFGPEFRVTPPRPRTRKMLLEHPDYYRLREELLAFLSECDAHRASHRSLHGPQDHCASNRLAACIT